MDVGTIPPMKPVLVEHVSDDINVLQKDDVTKQKTVLTARAIEDVFKCAPIDRSNAADAKFFNAQNKVDLNLIFEACSRTLLADQYVNGPTIYVNNVKSSVNPINQHGNQWAVNNSPVARVLHGFLYVYSVLDTGELSWYNYDNRISIDDQLDRSVDTRKISGKIRQVFVPNEFNDYLYMDGTKSDTYPKAHRSRYDLGVPWTRTGYPKYSLKTGNAEAGKIYCTKSGDVYTPIAGLTVGQALPSNTYVFDSIVWEDWYMMSKTHNGPEYFTNIRVEATSAISNPLADAVYHIYNEVPSFTLPNANLDAYRVGQKIIIEVHPPITAAQSSCRVFYQDTLSRGEATGDGQQQILITPRVRRNTKDIYGRVTNDKLVTSVACFELVEIKDGNNTYRSWEVDGGVEETDFTSGLAQILGEHTDRCSGDLVQYQRSSIANRQNVIVTYPLTSAGFVIARFLKKDETETLADNNWRAVVKIHHGNSDACFVRVTDYSSGPNSAYIYYRKENGLVFALAENNGHPTAGQFTEDKEYYYIDLTHTTSADVIQVLHGTGTSPDGYLTLNDLRFGRMRGFSAYGNRGDVLSIEITSGSSKTISSFQGKVFPVVMFCPDPHDSYIHKASINPSAFTYNQLTELFLDGTSIDDIRLANATELLEGLMNAPVATRALIEAYAYLATKLQEKGLLFGNCKRINVTVADFDRLVDGGFYYVIPKALSFVDPGHFPPYMTEAGCNIIVITNKKSPVIIHEEQGGIEDQDKAVQIATMVGDISDPSQPLLKVMYRVGTKNLSTGVWTWSVWQIIGDWSYIMNKPRYFHARWDYLNDPNNLINRVNQNSSSAAVKLISSTAIDVVHTITAEEVSALLTSVTAVSEDLDETSATHIYEETAINRDYEYSEPVSYKIPQFQVGISSYTANLNGKNYVVDVTLPDALVWNATIDKKRRRKIRFLLTGANSILNSGVKGIYLYVHYNAGGTVFKYLRNWGGMDELSNSSSMISPPLTPFTISCLDVEFEQVDLPLSSTRYRMWCPIEIG